MRLLICVFWLSLCNIYTYAVAEVRRELHLSFDLQALDGTQHPLSQDDRQVGRAFVFPATSCPISTSYIKELNRLKETLPRNTELYGVLWKLDITRETARTHFLDYGATFPLLFEASQMMRMALQPTHVPEAFVVAASGELIYRGAAARA